MPAACGCERRTMKTRPLTPSRRYFSVIIALAVFVWGMVVFSRSVPTGASSPGEQMTEQLAANSPDLTDARLEYERAHEALAQARARAVNAKKDFEDFVAQHFDSHRQTVQQLQLAQLALPADAPAEKVANPQYRDLAGRLQDLRERRQEMLGQMTPEHPEIRDVEVTIHDVERRMKGTPEFLAAPADAAGAVDYQRERELIAAYEAVHQRSLDAETAVREATGVERRAARRQSAARAQAYDHRVLSSSRAAVTHWPILALVCSLALVAGAAVAITGLRNTRTFISIEDVEASLRIPVIGVISNEGPAMVHQPRASRILRGLVLMSEITMALFVFAVTALSIDNVTFLSDLLTDPVLGFAYGMQRLVSMSVHHGW
jgi:hypothetical protein